MMMCCSNIKLPSLSLCLPLLIRSSLFLGLLTLFTACSFINNKWLNDDSLEQQVSSSPTLGELPAASDYFKQQQQLLQEQEQQLLQQQEKQQELVVSNETADVDLLQNVSSAYQEALLLAEDPSVRTEIQRRLAHINLQLAEERQINDAATQPQVIYQSAINAYIALLDNNPKPASLDQILYPLAKAYEMSGDIPNALNTFEQLVNKAPNSVYYSEAQFRRAEILFAAGEYAPASQAYKAVIRRSINKPDQSSIFLMNSWYMAGWSDFKLGRYTDALQAFFTVLDDQLNPDHDDIASSSQQLLTNDTLRVMSLAFSYKQGPETIGKLLDKLYGASNEPDYIDKLYKNLADLYLEKKRFIDSANTFSFYIDRYPQSEYAPQFHEQLIDVYIQGGFPERVREQKKSYVQSYAVNSQYWVATNAGSREAIQKNLSVYINELASYYHNLAQTKKQLRNKQLIALSKKEPTKANKKIQLVSEQEVSSHYHKAGNWYETWLANLPLSSETNSVWFLLGETRFESKDYLSAITAYEKAAYEPSHTTSFTAKDTEIFKEHSESAYAALLAYDRLIANLIAADSLQTDITQYQTAKNKSALLFANTFADDEHVNAVLAQTIQSLLTLKQYKKTIAVGQQLIARIPVLTNDPLNPSENKSDNKSINKSAHENQQFSVIAWLSIAHAQHELLQDNLAEQAYAQALSILREDETTSLYQKYYAATLDNYAASIYQQGVDQINVDEPRYAAEHFMRVVDLAAASSIRVSAQRDAISLFVQTQQWQRAIPVMMDFQQRFNNDTAAQAIPAQLLLAYVSLKNWPAAAAQAKNIAVNDNDSAVKQQALYSAAEFYQQAGDSDNAIDSYRSYAHSYPEPLADTIEAQYRLTELYAGIRAEDKRAYWLRKLIATHKAAKHPSNRSRYLAAFAAIDFAEKKLLAYQSISLDDPLKKSLARKRKAMQQALDAYQKAAAYDVELFSTQATYRVAEIYAGLASALFESERPAGLSALELEQYNFLLEEQAFPFEEKAIDFYMINVERSWQGIESDWVKSSYQALAKLMPARFDKHEIAPGEME